MKDYDRYELAGFSEEAKREWRDAHWEEDLKEKYDAECYVMPFDVCNRNSAAAALNALP